MRFKKYYYYQININLEILANNIVKNLFTKPFKNHQIMLKMIII